MDADARSPQPRSHRFSRVRVGRIRDRVKRSVAADHVAILVEPIAIGIVRAASRAERMIDRLRLVELARHLVARETSASKQRGKSDNPLHVSSVHLVTRLYPKSRS